MKLDFNIQVNQRQGLTLTAQVQQAIKLLHMTNQEIAEFVNDQFQDNPFVETTNFSEANSIQSNTLGNKRELDNSFKNSPYNQSENTPKVAIDNQFETGDAYIPKSTVSKADSDFDAVGAITAEPKSLYVHCLDFIDSNRFSGEERIIAIRLLEELEPTGWISNDLRSISHDLGCDLVSVENVLEHLQEIEPAGLFARNLQECLILQARETGVYDDKLAIVLDNLHLIANGKFDLLKRRSSCTDEEISNIFKTIKSFHPKPGLKFEHNEPPIREPDLKVSETDKGWIVELNNSTLPSIKIEKTYAKEVRSRIVEKSDREFVQTKVAEAKWLTKAIEKRNETMLKVGSEIVKRQKNFLLKVRNTSNRWC